MSLEDISTQIKHYVFSELETVLKDISEKYKISFDDLKKNYLIQSTKQTIETIETVETINDVAVPKKRGRKKKVKEEYIETDEYEYEGVTYLVDNKNIAYSNNVKSPTVLGEKLVDGTIKFYKKS